jgi:hypothetical protein
MAQNVLAKQYLAIAALETAQVDLGFGQRDPLFAQLGNAIDGQEHPATADLCHNPGYHRVVVTAKADDDVVYLPDTLTARREQLMTYQAGQMHVGTVH